MKDCRGELLEQARRGLGLAPERTAFEAHLHTCESCRMTLAVRSDFDAVGEAEAGDWERVAHLAGVGVAMYGKNLPGPIRRLRRAWPLAFAALAVVGVAAAGVTMHGWQMPLWRNSHSKTGEVVSVGSTVRASSGQARAARSPAAVETEGTGTLETVDDSAPRRTTDLPSAAIPESPSTAKSAKDTYSTANDARRAGRISEAIAGYQKLQRLYPDSAEARASRVSLGGLLFKTGSHQGALAQFDAYLASNGGQLAAEALFGRAQAQRALGRSAEEAQNLDRLVRTYPQSAYATHAERRLRELR